IPMARPAPAARSSTQPSTTDHGRSLSGTWAWAATWGGRSPPTIFIESLVVDWGVWAGGPPGYPNLSGKDPPVGSKCAPRSANPANELVGCRTSLVMFVLLAEVHAPFRAEKI